MQNYLSHLTKFSLYQPCTNFVANLSPMNLLKKQAKYDVLSLYEPKVSLRMRCYISDVCVETKNNHVFRIQAQFVCCLSKFVKLR